MKQDIYWLCDDLRRMEQIGLKGSPNYLKKKNDLDILNQKYLKAKKLYDDFLKKCSETYYFK